MKKRFFAYHVDTPEGITMEEGVFDSKTGLMHSRPAYTQREIKEVTDWLNGEDRPLPPNIKDRWIDPRDPYNIQADRGGFPVRVYL